MVTTFDIFLEQTISEIIMKLLYIGHMMIPTLSHGGVNEGGEEKDDDHLGEAVEELSSQCVIQYLYTDIR